MNRISKKRHKRGDLAPPYKQESSRLQTRKQPSSNTECQHLDLDVPSFQNCEK